VVLMVDFIDKVKKLIRKFRDIIGLVFWAIKVSQKPDKADYMSVLRLGLLIVLILGTYAFIFSITGYMIIRPGFAAPPYPLNIVVIITVVCIILISTVFLIYSVKKSTRPSSRRKRR